MIREAACSCGALGLRVRGEPVRVSVCHCHACQRRTGSAFGAQARFAAAQVEAMVGEPTTWARAGDAGARIEYRFCGVCGATLYYTLDVLPGFVAIPIGAFADASFPPPSVAIYEVRRHPWVWVEGVERFD